MPLDTDPRIGGLQAAPLPPDVRYVLDGMLDNQQLDEGSYVALNMFVPRQPLLGILDGEPGSDDRALPGEQLSRRRRLEVPILDLVDDTLGTLPGDVAAGLTRMSLRWLNREIDALANVLAGWAIEDEVTGGCMTDWRRQPRMHHHGAIWTRTRRRVWSPQFINRYVKRAAESRALRIMATRLLARTDRYGAIAFDMTALVAELDARREEARQIGIAKILAEAEAITPQALLLNGPTRCAVARRRRERRKTLKRAYALAATVLPAADLQAFNQGAFVRLQGHQVDLLVRRDRSMSAHGHGALDVRVSRPGGAEVVAKLCVYVERTPALDQLVAFSLAMRAGEEAEIIDTANILKLTDSGREIALLAEREKRHVAQRSVTSARPMWDRSSFRAKVEEYIEATHAQYVDRLRVVTCGRRAHLLEGCT